MGIGFPYRFWSSLNGATRPKSISFYPKTLHGQTPVLTSFSVTLITVGQELGKAKALTGPSRNQTQKRGVRS